MFIPDSGGSRALSTNNIVSISTIASFLSLLFNDLRVMPSVPNRISREVRIGGEYELQCKALGLKDALWLALGFSWPQQSLIDNDRVINTASKMAKRLERSRNNPLLPRINPCAGSADFSPTEPYIIFIC